MQRNALMADLAALGSPVMLDNFEEVTPLAERLWRWGQEGEDGHYHRLTVDPTGTGGIYGRIPPFTVVSIGEDEVEIWISSTQECPLAMPLTYLGWAVEAALPPHMQARIAGRWRAAVAEASRRKIPHGSEYVIGWGAYTMARVALAVAARGGRVERTRHHAATDPDLDWWR